MTEYVGKARCPWCAKMVAVYIPANTLAGPRLRHHKNIERLNCQGGGFSPGWYDVESEGLLR